MIRRNLRVYGTKQNLIYINRASELPSIGAQRTKILKEIVAGGSLTFPYKVDPALTQGTFHFRLVFLSA